MESQIKGLTEVTRSDTTLVSDAIAPKPNRMGQRQLGIHEQIGTFDATARARANIAAGSENGKKWAKNAHDQMEAIFYYGDEYFTVDVDLVEHPETGEVQVLEVVLLCPKCAGPLRLTGRNWTLNFTDARKAPDRLWRPLITLDGTFICTYAESERSGVKEGRTNGVLRTACNFMGSIENGQCRRQFITGASPRRS